jgi:anti-anti-sigma factor
VTGPTQPALSIAVKAASEGVVVVTLSGDLETSTVEELRALLAGQAPGASIVVDVSGLDFIDSSGLNALAVSARAVREATGLLVVAGAPEQIARVFEIVHLSESVSVQPSLAEALNVARQNVVESGQVLGEH